MFLGKCCLAVIFSKNTIQQRPKPYDSTFLKLSFVSFFKEKFARTSLSIKEEVKKASVIKFRERVMKPVFSFFIFISNPWYKTNELNLAY